MTHFEEIYIKNTPSILLYMSCVSKVQGVEKNIIVQVAILCTLKENLVMGQNCMKKQAYQGYSEHQFGEGD
jgi:hypothetical protein